jgi:glycosyltransferase involved in cell wall biosynthesis
MDIGLVAVGSPYGIGGHVAASSIIYRHYCQMVADEIGIAPAVALHFGELPEDVILSILEKCAVLCVPGVPGHKRASAAIATCFAFHKPVVADGDQQPNFDNCICAIPERASPEDIAGALHEVIANEEVYNHYCAAAKWLSYYRRPEVIAAAYLEFLKR